MQQDRLKTLINMLESDPKDSFVRYALAKEYERLNDKDNALQQYLLLRTFDPDYIGLYYHMAKLYESLEQLDEALETYTIGIEIAKRLSDNHALSELMSAKMNLEIDL